MKYCITEQDASKKSSGAWLKTVLTSGTLSDKMAALVLLVQEAPLHNLTSLDSLLSMVKKKGGRRELLPVLGSNLLVLCLTGLFFTHSFS
jgi:hypothetical protein